MQLLRIDDYPTGVRPILPGMLKDYNRMLHELPMVHLGIVPEIYLDLECNLYRTHKNIIPCMHGIHHRHKEFSKKLIEADDPYNERGTVPSFDEWENHHVSIGNLEYYRKLLSQSFDYEVGVYIPVCNYLTPDLAVKLEKAGFTQILCETSEYSNIPIIQSDYYGRLDDMKGKHDIICLHLTWEWDTVRNKGFNYWKKLVHEKL